MTINAKGKPIPFWTMDSNGLCASLPLSPVQTTGAEQDLVLVPMGGARLRISAFPVIDTLITNNK